MWEQEKKCRVEGRLQRSGAELLAAAVADDEPDCSLFVVGFPHSS